ncbi:hypothetical protein [Bacillus sp. P14.5]|uniref:hypothetical protein n=1 Tax=Bacillus sp. P14.5 TaxID=1983400 RepID=UPI000DEA05D3|nr:hypothetical protein [Bacillus sp. P14.5]
MNELGAAKEFSLYTSELAACLAMCGYESIAGEVLQIYLNNNSDEEIEMLIAESEATLNSKSLLDSNRNSFLIQELENLIHLLVKSNKKARCVTKESVLFIHSILGADRVLIQQIRDNTHFFLIINIEEGFDSILKNHYKMNIDSFHLYNHPSIKLTEQIFDQLHTLEDPIIEYMRNDKKVDSALKEFLLDFRKNNKTFDNLSLMETNYTNNRMDIKEVTFFIPSVSNIWHLDYEGINKDQIFIHHSSPDKYIRRLSESILTFIK